jgi:ribosomal-protein-alanine N-acetyltransferase
MTKKSNLTPFECQHRLQNVLPGEASSDSLVEPPVTSIYFTKISRDSLQEFHSYSTDQRLYEFFEFRPFENIADTEAYYNKMEKRMNDEKSHYYWFLRLKKSNKLIGSASLANINFQRHSVEWGQGIDPNYWGGNHNLEVHELLKHFIFDVLKMNRIFGQTMVTNERAISGVKASGCAFEGILRQFYRKDDNYIDGWSYSLLAAEYFDQVSLLNQINLNIKIEEIVNLISDALESDEISKETKMSDCWMWDSLSHVVIIIAISSKYNVKITPLEVSQLTSVDRIYKYLTKD